MYSNVYAIFIHVCTMIVPTFSEITYLLHHHHVFKKLIINEHFVECNIVLIIEIAL